MMKSLTSLGLALALPSLGLAQQTEPSAAWRQFTAAQGDTWRAEWNRATGTPKAIFGPGLRLPGAITALEQAREESEGLITRFGDLLGKGDSAFAEIIGVKAGRVYVFVYDQKFAGLDVISGRADVRINEVGVVAMFGASAVKIPAGFGIVAGLPAAAAAGIAADEVLGGAAAQPDPKPRLVIWADTEGAAPARPVLAWEVQIDERPAKVSVGKAYVDAKTGAFLEFKNEVLTCSCGSTHVYRAAPATGPVARLNRSLELAATAPRPAAPKASAMALTGQVLAWTNMGHLPVDPLTRVPMTNLLVTSSQGSAYTDASGNFSIPYSGTAPVTVTATLAGRHSKRIRVAQGTQLTASKSVTPGTPATLEFGSQFMGEFDRAQTTTYWFVDDVNTWLRSLLPGANSQIGLMSNVDPRVNMASSCNAYYTGYTINFYNKAGSCNMTAFETVIQHEWGHGIDQAFGGISQTEGLSEGWGDILGLYRSGQPQLGPGFTVGATTGIRAGTNTRTYPSGSGPHDQGLTWMGFAWDVRTNLIATLGSAAGIARAEAIVVASIAADATNQPDAVREVFILDDDDGNLLNGTPNYFDLEKAALKRRLPYPVRQNPNAGSYVTYGIGCPGSGQKSANCLNVNDTGTPQNFSTRSGLTYALQATAPTAMMVTGFELYTSGSQTLTTRLYAANASGQPGATLGTSTITVGGSTGWYRTTFPAAIPLGNGQKFFLAFTNDGSATNISASIRAGSDTPYFRNDGIGGSWNGPIGGFPWAYRVTCVGGPGAVPELGFSGLPELNQTFTLTLARAKPSSIGMLILGVSDSNWNGTNLPLDLTLVGAAGCKLFASAEVLVGFNTNASGGVTQNFAVPNVPALVGGLFYNQYAVGDTSNNFGIVFSNAGRGKIGKQ